MNASNFQASMRQRRNLKGTTAAICRGFHKSLETCPVCNSSRHRPFATVCGHSAADHQSFRYLECAACGSVFLSRTTPQPDGIYHANYFLGRKGSLARLETAWTAIGFRLRLRRAPSIPMGAKILDVGCGNGAWMEFLAARGFDAHGLDPSEEACSAARRRGLQNIHQGTLEKHGLPEASFDAITAVHCMEHDPDPRAFVAGAVRLLKPGGWLGVTIPNIASWEARRARGEWFHLDPPYHLCLPSPRAVSKIFAASGLNDLRARCPSFDYCQSLLYATGWRRDLPLPLTAVVLPFAAAFNLALALGRQAGTIEYWGRLTRNAPWTEPS